MNQVGRFLDVREELPKQFPDRELKVERDGPVYKIDGDLRL